MSHERNRRGRRPLLDTQVGREVLVEAALDQDAEYLELERCAAAQKAAKAGMALSRRV